MRKKLTRVQSGLNDLIKLNRAKFKMSYYTHQSSQKEKRRDEDQSPFSWLQLLSLRFLRSRINSVQKKRSFHRKLPVLARRLYQEGECLDLSKQLK
jgi:hypothetical protein